MDSRVPNSTKALESQRRFAALVIGGSAGSIEALALILPALPRDFPIPILVALHIPAQCRLTISDVFSHKCKMTIREAKDNDIARPAVAYFAPPDRHLLIGEQLSLALSADPPIHFSRPAIDVLFMSASKVLGAHTVGIVLSGANPDGAAGLADIYAAGGTAIVQNPESARSSEMPRAALKACPGAQAMNPDEIVAFLSNLSMPE